ncbi:MULTISPECIES: head decoration protein [unclassified Thioalkalivibrio]|uniref:head decoration protein n=1 Tax=unclassified Thioalkalivibrio TaxID=2621013 RepID=UPI0004766F03|nr:MULTISPECIES: head decoration protein [unclassified Thioalkalivibrio]
MSHAMFDSSDFENDILVAGNAHLLVARSITVKDGQELKRGAVIGKDGDGKHLLSKSAADDGSETPDLILAQDVDATGGDTAAIAYSRGDFAEPALTLGDGHDLESIREGLREKGIILMPVQAA